ncbi:imidazole glycerol phosphate synthase, glutamine amidotransferase subunit [Candidatus Adlerbacteria bacterium RIFCSPHIGHO2_02_FULL_54_18]|uniref:Imidazole glycerol phosphate synthase subunit HisH n=2 Tax=Candidatus Adleribacteriota TaxID=1752736 RepID=A0A1F4Y2J9_9BACT|nr:MAG: imidazole glycerol phosphate synthase, glutamine amidotransferase subunit [Candidatus Adlerbacteria bacterium RIFCSPLOWO2_01_FULL_54_21b]OGC88006.1 MAG: imidazole glycerol phosphate synthase, glutamine amidotransferase subunit [Candidatus Adlerbacteria bacterium RIFCSPHIGHO2_02_FULL_54_18]
MIAVVDYGMGNVASVRNALALLGAEAIITARAEDFERATHIILPGVGAFPDGMRELWERGLIPVLRREVLENQKPFLGICLGMQLLAEAGEEGGDTKGLGFIAGKTRKLTVAGLRLPHIGWDDVTSAPGARLFADIDSRDFYFVHSYVMEPADSAAIAATCTYGEAFAAAVQKDNIFGVQFHPEKSQKAGIAVLRNFINL